MIINALIDLVMTVFTPLVHALPSVSMSLPSTTGFAAILAHVDSLVPILPVLAAALAVLSCVGAFFALRLAIVLWHVVYP